MCKRANREGGALSPSRIIGLRGRPGPCCSGLYISMPTLQLKLAHMAAPPLKQERGHVTRAEAGEEERTKANNNNNHLGSADVRKALAKCGKMVSLRRNGLSGDLYQGKGEALDPLPPRSGCALHLVADTIKRPRPDDALLACNGRFPTHLEEDSCVDLDQKNARCKAIDVDNCRFLGQIANGEAIEEEVEDQVMESAACIRVSVEEKKAQALGDDGHNLFGQVQNAEAIEVAVEEDQMMESVACNRASVEEKKAQASGEDGRKFFGQVQNGDDIEEAEEVQVIVPVACIRVAIEEKEAQDFGEDGQKLFGLVQNSEAIEEEEEQEEDEAMEAATYSRISEEEKKAEAIGEDGRIFFGQVQTGEAIEEEKEEVEEEDDDDQVMESVTCIRVSVEEKKAGSFGEDRQKFFGHGRNCKAIEEEEKEDQVIEDVICNSISNKEKKSQAIREDGQKFCRQGQNVETMEEEDERMEVMAKHGKRDKDVDEEENRVMTEKMLEINRDEKKDTHDAETSKVVDEEENRVLMKEKMVEINKDEKKDTCHAETTDGLKEVTGIDLGESKDLLEEDLELARQNQSFKGVETETKRFTEQGGSNTEAVEKKKSRALEDERDADSSEEVEATVLEAEIMKDQEYQSMDGMKSTMLEELKSGSEDTNGLKAGQKRKPLTDGPVKKAKKKPVNVWVKSSSRRKKKALKQIAEPEDCVALYPIDRNQGRLEDGPDVPILLSRINKSESIELSEDRLAAGSTKGYRMVRSTRGVVEGAWYFEIEVQKLGPTGHTRLGWSTSKGEIQGPVGYDSHSYAYRDVDGSKVHAAIREPYGEGYVEGDVIGFYINLPNGRNYAPKPPPIVCYRGQPWFLEVAEEPLKVVPGSEILLFRNGICQGIAFKDIYAGRYYPAASMYTLPNQPKCSIQFNFGPNFRFPPDEIGERPAPLPMFHAPFSSLDGSEVEARQSVEEIVMI